LNEPALSIAIGGWVAGLARNVREEFAERFKLALDEAGLRDMRELAAALGVTAQAVRKWREGDSIPTAEHAPLLAEKLGVRRAWLLDGELPMRPRVVNMAEKTSSYASDEFSISKDEFKFLSDYRSLPSGMRTVLEQLLEAMKKELKRK
jgi:transcriptional regulator with XRE-family HTH domain